MLRAVHLASSVAWGPIMLTPLWESLEVTMVSGSYLVCFLSVWFLFDGFDFACMTTVLVNGPLLYDWM